MNSSAQPERSPQSQDDKKTAILPTTSTTLRNGELVEMVYEPVERKTRFVVGTADAWGYEDTVSLSPTERLVPYSPTNNLIRHGIVLFPTEPEEYGTEADLVSRIRGFIHEYVDVSDEFEEIAAYYVLFTWVYDDVSEVPYVRVRGGYGSGKTRFLLTVGSICYKPIFASAASTVSPLFRLIDSFRGTLILDESDFRYSDEKSEIVKILNNGTSRGFPVLRTEVNAKKEFDPRAYEVFGPKVIATRGFFQDKALESRCLTEDMRGGRLRGGIPLNLDQTYRDTAERLRNQLLLYRFRHRGAVRTTARAGARDLEPRLEQLFGPLVSVIADAAARERVMASLVRYNDDLADDRAESTEAQVLAVIRDFVGQGKDTRLAVQDLSAEFATRFGAEYGERVTPRWIGSILRRRLGLKPQRSNGLYSLGPEEVAKLRQLYARYGVDAPATVKEDQKTDVSPT